MAQLRKTLIVRPFLRTALSACSWTRRSRIVYELAVRVADEVDAQSEEDWDVAGAVAELPQLSDSDLEEEEGDDRDRSVFY